MKWGFNICRYRSVCQHNWIFAGRIQGVVDLKNFSLQFQRRMNALVVLQHYFNSSLSSVSMLLFITATVTFVSDSFLDLLIALFFRFLKDFINLVLLVYIEIDNPPATSSWLALFTLELNPICIINNPLSNAVIRHLGWWHQWCDMLELSSYLPVNQERCHNDIIPSRK